MVEPTDWARLDLVSPTGGSAYKLGDSLHIRATVESNVRGSINALDVFLSPDAGKTWGALSDQSIPVAPRSDFDYSWKIPTFFAAGGKTFSLAGNGWCRVRIAQRNTGDSLKIAVSGDFLIEDTVFIRLTHPLGGESFHVGDTLSITWTTKYDAGNPVDAVDVKISPDSGKTWAYPRAGSITPESPSWGRYSWVVPDSISVFGKKSNLVGNPGVCIAVEQYTDPQRRFQSGMISISP